MTSDSPTHDGEIAPEIDTITVRESGVNRVGCGNPVLHILLDHSPVNALTPAMVSAIGEAIALVTSDHRAVIVSSSLPRVFMAGGDIATLVAPGAEIHSRYVRSIQELVVAFKRLPQPVICAVGGFCLGGGLELALACDIVVAAEDAVLGLPEVRLGIIPAAGGVHHLGRRIGEGRARALLMTGNRLGAAEALAAGLVDIVEPRQSLLSRAEGLAKELSALPATALREIKRLSAESLDHPVREGLGIELEAWNRARASDEAQAALDAFQARR